MGKARYINNNGYVKKTKYSCEYIYARGTNRGCKCGKMSYKNICYRHMASLKRSMKTQEKRSAMINRSLCKIYG